MTSGLTWFMTTTMDYPRSSVITSDTVCQPDLADGAICVTSFSQGHPPIGTMALRAIVRD